MKIFVLVVIFFYRQNSVSLKLVQLFDLKWVNRQDLVRGSSFFGQIPSFRPPKWHFYENFCFSGRFFLSAEFSLRQLSATFRLEIGQWEGLPWRIIVFQPNSIVLVFKMAFFKNFRFGARFFLCAKIQFRLNWCNFQIGNGSTDWTPQEVHRFLAKFHRFGL